MKEIRDNHSLEDYLDYLEETIWRKNTNGE